MNQVAPGFLSLSPSTSTLHEPPPPPFDTTVATSTFVFEGRPPWRHNEGKLFFFSSRPGVPISLSPLRFRSPSSLRLFFFTRDNNFLSPSEWCLQFVDDCRVQMNCLVRILILDFYSILFFYITLLLYHVVFLSCIIVMSR